MIIYVNTAFPEHKCLTKITFLLTHFDCATCKYSIIIRIFKTKIPPKNSVNIIHLSPHNEH